MYSAKKSPAVCPMTIWGIFVLVFFHVYADAIADVVADKDFSSSHRVPCYVSCVAMNDYFSFVHCVAAAILCVTMYHYFWSVHKCAKVVSWGSVNVNLDVCFKISTDVSLSAHIVYFYFFKTFSADCLSE